MLCSIFMNKYGANGFFVYLFIFHMIIGLFGMYRITRRETKENPDSTFTPLPRNITPLGIELDPTTGADLSNSANNKWIKKMHQNFGKSFKKLAII